MNLLRKSSTGSPFPVYFNLLPHFTAAARDPKILIRCVKEALSDGRIQSFFLADHPVHRQEFSSLRLAEDILAAGGEPVVSLALANYDRNSILDRLRQYYRTGVRSFVLVSGDYPSAAGSKTAPGVFDLDSVQLFMLLDDVPEAADITRGCVVSPFKYFESEQVWQYEKLRRKIEVGADFIVTQIGYDLRKFDELLRFCRRREITAPLVANVFGADLQTAGLIQARCLPGVRMESSLLRRLQAEKSDRQGVMTRTAKTLAVVKGLGYHGALLGSTAVNFSETGRILDSFDHLEREWRNFVPELDFSEGSAPRFYYFRENPENSLNSDEPAPVALKHFPSPTYSFSYFIDWLIYVPRGPLFKLTGRFCYFCRARKFWYGFLWLLEYVSKHPLYGCKMCGDCTLYACGFLCYQAGCPKKMLNGPCGGSIDGYCEVYPEKRRCYWVKVYHHMKGVRQQVSFTAPPMPARDNALNRTSSWINFFTGRDHRKLDFAPDGK